MDVVRNIFYIIAFITTMSFLTADTSADSLWRDRNIYASGQNLKVGDILLVTINDISKMSFNMSVNSDNSFNFVSNPDKGITGFLPKAAASRKRNNVGNTKVRGANNLRISIPATITENAKFGKFKINGERQYSFNGVSSKFIISGVIDPVILQGRQVDSADIAEFNLNIHGFREGAGVSVTRPELKKDETAKTDLTEQEKQKIIIDYLNKTLNELTQ